MKFLCLAYGDEDGWNLLSENEKKEVLSYDKVIRDRGNLMSAVRPKVTSVRNWDKKLEITEKPYAQPELVNKLVLLSATFKRSGMRPGFFEGFKNASMEKMLPKALKEAYLKASPDPKGLQRMFDRDIARMGSFKDISDELIRAIRAPALVVNGNTDVVRPEHALELFHLLPHAKLAIIPGGHGEYLGEITSINKDSKIPLPVTAMIEELLM